MAAVNRRTGFQGARVIGGIVAGHPKPLLQFGVKGELEEDALAHVLATTGDSSCCVACEHTRARTTRRETNLYG